ncbi:MAG: TonB-dependent receptor [Bacteroidales bacterium]|nr:TonB-dependent receptor [Bacteroidales bacterium]
MNFRRIIVAFFSIMISFAGMNAQDGIIRGSVFDKSTGEAMIMVTVAAEGTTTGTFTDLDGKFNLKITPGTYNLNLSFVGYNPLTLNDVTVTDGEVTLLDNIMMSASTVELEEVTVTAEMSRNNENALMTLKMQSASVMDGISSVNFKKMGDSDAASSMKRVTGVSVEGGKYVYVRGLGDRYTKTILNGMDIPGLDPDRNTMQLDIFPTNIIDNIMVYKSFRADMPADFTGGVIDISIKDFPQQKKGSIFIGGGYNPDYHFNSNYVTYPGSSTDFLGFDNGSRDIPAIENIPSYVDILGNPGGEEAIRYREILEGFNPNMSAMRANSFMDYNFGASFGNQVPLENITIGYNFGFSYKNNTEYYKNAEYGRYGLSSDPDVTEMEVREFQIGDYGSNSVLMSGLAGFAVKTKKSKFRLNAIHMQNGVSKAGIFNFEGSDQGSVFSALQQNLEYNQRSLTNILLDGKHTLTGAGLDIVWKISPTISSISDPDARFIRYLENGDDYYINTEGGFPERIWRDLQEYNISSVLHITKKYDFAGEEAKLNFGGAYTYKERDFVIRKYALNVRNVPLTGNPDEIFYPENLWPLNGTDYISGTTYEANFIPDNPNKFNSSAQLGAAYISTEIVPFKNFKAIIGVRAEKYAQYYTGQDQQGINVLENDKVMDYLDLFPSVNLVYALSDGMNLRLAYARTTARPSFKEMSFAEIADPLSGRTFVGGMFDDRDRVLGLEYWDGDLRSSYIHNFDLRWEYYHDIGQMVSASAFYKEFIDPIEIVQYATYTGAFQPRNVGDGQVMGLEFEVRQDLGLISKAVEDFSVITNVSFTRSEIKLSATEYLSKVENARTGEIVEEKRVMAGQAPYIINAGASYNGGKKGFWKGFEAGLFYNVQGTTLQYVGIADRPDIFMLPFHSLNFTTSKKFGKDQRAKISFKITNLLDDKKESVFRSFNPTDQYFTKLEPGITFSAKFSYALF